MRARGRGAYSKKTNIGVEGVMSGTIDQAVEHGRKQAKGEQEDPRKGPGHTGPAEGSGIPDDDGESATPDQPRSTPMAGQKP
jgi:hypothetical protein